MSGLFANSGQARMWRFGAALFLFAGCVGLTERIWTLSADLYARKTWPMAEGEIISASEQDDTDLSRRSGSIRGHTRYWVEYEVAFAVAAEQCRTTMVYEGPGESRPCHGIIDTRSTQSSARAFQWLLHEYYVHEPVKVLWDPAGTGRTDIKLAGESIWLRYNTDRLFLSLCWVLAFGGLYVFSCKRLEYFQSHPEQEVWLQAAEQDEEQLTTLDI